MRSPVHKRTKHPLYKIWNGIIHRCNNPKDQRYSKYGGRGISVCKRWLIFDNFVQDMGDRPSLKHSIERIDNNGNYNLKNCRWATDMEQHRNTRANRFVTFMGVTQTMQDWANQLGIGKVTLSYRLNNWSVERALTTNKRTYNCA